MTQIFIVFIVLTSFAVLNLFIAIIVDSLQAKHFDEEDERDQEAQADRAELHGEIAALSAQVARLTELVERSSKTSDDSDDKKVEKDNLNTSSHHNSAGSYASGSGNGSTGRRQQMSRPNSGRDTWGRLSYNSLLGDVVT